MSEARTGGTINGRVTVEERMIQKIIFPKTQFPMWRATMQGKPRPRRADTTNTDELLQSASEDLPEDCHKQGGMQATLQQASLWGEPARAGILLNGELVVILGLRWRQGLNTASPGRTFGFE